MNTIREEVARVARDLYMLHGKQQGRDLDNWLDAENLVITWYESEYEREGQVGKLKPVLEHRIPPTHDEVEE